jgi:hypothetical protein
MLRRHYFATLGFVVLLFLLGTATTRAVPEPKNNFHFSILGDRTGGALPEIYGRTWREIDLLHPDFVISVGDTIAGDVDSRAASDWAAVRAIWQRYPQYPLYLTPGNHDIWSDASEKIYEKETGRKPSYSFNFQSAHFVVLDNSRTTDLSEDQLRFLEEDLKANPDRKPLFIFFHRPFWLLPLKLGSGEFGLHQIARKYGVGYIVCGHGHQFARVVRDGIVYLEVGSSGGNMARGINSGQGFAQGWFYHHVWATVQGTKVEMTIKELDGAKGKGRMFRAEDWGDNGPKFDAEDPAASEKPLS